MVNRLGILTTVMVFANALSVSSAQQKHAEQQAKGVSPEKATRRLAIIDVGRDIAVPSALLTLLEGRLCTRQDLQLVERQEIETLLREHKISLMLSQQTDSSQAIQVGKLIKADVLLLLEAEKITNVKPPRQRWYNGNRARVRLHLIDTQYGLRLLDQTVWMKIGDANLESAVDPRIRQIVDRWQSFDLHRENPVLVGMATIRCLDNVTERYQGVGESLTRELEKRFSKLPGVILTERQKAADLTKERWLAEGLPEALRGSCILVTGYYKINYQTEEVNVFLILYTKGTQIPLRKVSGPYEKLEPLCGRIAKQIKEKLPSVISKSTEPGIARKKTEEEVDILLQEVKKCFSQKRFGLALTNIEAAIALAPKMAEPRILYVKTVIKWIRNVRWRKKTREAEQFGKYDESKRIRDQYLREVVPYFSKAVETYKDLLKGKYGQVPDKVKKDTGERLFWCPSHIGGFLKESDNLPAVLQELSVLMESAYAVYCREIGDKDQFLLRNTGNWWHVETLQTRKAREKIILLMLKKRLKGKKEANYFHFSDLESPFYPTDRNVHRAFMELMSELAKDPSPYVQAYVELSYIFYYGDFAQPTNPALSLTHFKRYVELLVEDIYPSLPPKELNSVLFWPSQILAHFKDHWDAKEINSITLSLCKAVLDSKQSAYWNMKEPNASYTLGELLFFMVRRGKAKEVVEILELCLARQVNGNSSFTETNKLYLRQVLEKVYKRHPELSSNQSASSFLNDPDKDVIRIKILANLLRRQFNEEHRLLVTDTTLANTQALFPEIKKLNLGGTGVTDAGLVYLKKAEHLTSLSLANTQVTDAGLMYLKEIKSLAALSLKNCKVTDAGLMHLSSLPKLRSLCLINTAVTGSGLKQLKHLAVLDLACSPVTDSGFEGVKGLHKLTCLYLGNTGITDQGAACIAHLKNLKALNLYYTSISDAALLHLKGLKNLQFLSVSTCSMITGTGLRHLKNNEKLKTLILAQTFFTDKEMSVLVQLHNVEVLDLKRTKVTDQGLASIHRLPQLRQLDLSRTEITDAGILYLKNLKNLEKLVLEGCPYITDKSLPVLQGCMKLKKLYLRQCSGVTDKGIASLKKALPKLRIIR